MRLRRAGDAGMKCYHPATPPDAPPALRSPFVVQLEESLGGLLHTFLGSKSVQKKKIHPCKQGGFALSAVAAKGMNLEPKLTRPDPLSLGWSFRGDFYGATFLLGLWRQAKNRGEKNRISDTDGYLAVFWNQRSRFLQLENGKGRDMKRRGGPGWPRLCPEDTSPAGLCIPLPTMEEIFQGSPYIPQDPRSGCCSSCPVSVPCPQARAPAPRATCVRPSRHPVFQNALGASASVL